MRLNTGETSSATGDGCATSTGTEGTIGVAEIMRSGGVGGIGITLPGAPPPPVLAVGVGVVASTQVLPIDSVTVTPLPPDKLIVASLPVHVRDIVTVPPVEESIIFLSADDTVKVEPVCSVTVKSVALTVIDSISALEPETVKLVLSMVITASVVNVTSSKAAKTKRGDNNKPKKVIKYVFILGCIILLTHS